MLIRLTPEQIAKHWEQIEFAIANSLPPMIGEAHEKMNNILVALLGDKMQAWASCVINDGSVKVSGFVVTQMLDDAASKTRSLLIYCLYAYNTVSESEWIDGFKTLKKFSGASGCRRIVAYSNVPYIIELAKRLGANADYTFLYFD